MSPLPKKSVSRESDKFMLRFPDGMRERIAREAFISDRSMNAEIIHRLESSMNLIIDEASLMTAIKVLNGYAEKFDCTVSFSISRKSVQILEAAIKNGYLPADATLEDLDEPTAAIARLKAQKAAIKKSMSRSSGRTLSNAPTLADAPTMATAATLRDLPTVDDLPTLSMGPKAKRKPKT